ncbi:MAG TPA: rhomboid family intramembrane serine protease [Ktedonobacterales bacterium]|nr:rhomboid family intramembrane serine protease [Ktedonobacterales bacterium]
MEQQQQASAQSSQIERGDTLLKQGDVREAAEIFAGVVRAEPNNPAGHLGLAEASLALGDFATMQQACAQVQQLAPQSSEAAVARALLATLNQRFDIALQEVEHSIELDPTRGYAHALRAYVLRRLGQRYDGALAEARAGRTWGTRDLDHLFANVPKPAETLPTVAAGADFAPKIPTTPGPRTWDQRSTRERQMVRARFAVRGVPVVTYSLMAINIGIFILGIFPGGSALYNFGVAQGNLILSDPVQAFRLLTSMFLHANLLHIATNMLSLFFIGVAVEQLFGSGRYAFIYFASGIIAGLTQMIILPGVPFLGASGAIAGIFGAFGALILLRRRTLGPAGNALIGQWLFWLAINAFISISNPGIAGWAHLGGLVAGFIIGAIMTTMDGRRRVRAGY